MTKKVGIFDVSIKTEILKPKEAAPKGMTAENASPLSYKHLASYEQIPMEFRMFQ